MLSTYLSDTIQYFHIALFSSGQNIVRYFAITQIIEYI